MKRQTYDGLKKRCDHARKQWSECACPWHYDFTWKGSRTLVNPHGKNRGVLGRFLTRAEAETAFGAVKDRITHGLTAVVPVPTVSTTADTVESYGRKWLAWLQDLKKKSTVGFYTDNFENHIVPALGSVSLTALTRSQCKQFAMQIRQKDLARPTMVGIVTTLSALGSAAVEDDDCPVTINPAARIAKLVRDPNATKSRRLSKDKYFERDEVDDVLTVARDQFPDWYPFVLCGFRTGLRLGELLGLEWGDIDWRRSFIHVRQAWVRKELTTPKNGLVRDVDMSSKLRTELRLWRKRQSSEWLRRGLSRPALVFPSDARTPLDDANVRKIFAALVKKADLRHRSPHAMRHSFISLLLQNGEPLAYVQKQAGHRSMDITLNVYGHFIPGGNRAAVDRLDAESGHTAKSA